MLQTAFWPSCMNRVSFFEWHKRFKEGRESVRYDERWGGVRKSIYQSWLAKELGLGLLCWGFKGVQEEIPSKEASTLQIGSVSFPTGQCTSPLLHPCYRLFEQDGHQDSSTPPYSPYLAPCDLVIPLAQRLSLWYNRGYKRGCNKGHRHVDTRGVPWRLQVVGTVQQMDCNRRRLLGRGLKFYQ